MPPLLKLGHTSPIALARFAQITAVQDLRGVVANLITEMSERGPQIWVYRSLYRLHMCRNY